MVTKHEMRRLIKGRLKGIGPESRARQEAEVIHVLSHDACWGKSSWIFGYLPMGTEFNLEPLLSLAILQGKHVALPRVDGSMLRFYRIPDLNQEWELHGYGMREPAQDLPPVDVSVAVDEGLLVIVPGLAYDMNGYRIGYGGGFYDRLLALIGKVPHACFAACLFHEQLVPRVPREDHDYPLNRLFIGKEGLVK